MAGKETSKARAVKRASAELEPTPAAPAKPRAKTAARKPPARVTLRATPKPKPKQKDTRAVAVKPAQKPLSPAPPARGRLAKPLAAAPVSEPSPAPRRAARSRRAPRAAAPSEAVPELAATATPLTEEERIESSKYDVRERPRRVFEEERFLFPETYESDRVRLLVKDPEWLFAHWDVSPGSLQRLRDDLGERATALSRLTLRLEDPADSALSVVLLPEGARSWYVKTHASHRAYRAALGVTMPSGEFRPLATSNVVVAPRGVPSPQKARRRISFARAHAAEAAAELERTGGLSRSAPEHAAAVQPTADAAGAVDYIDGRDASPRPEPEPGARGGASDALGPGGASDIFRR